MFFARTALLLFASGVLLIKLYPATRILLFLGAALLLFSMVITMISLFRFYRTKRRIEHECQ